MLFDAHNHIASPSLAPHIATILADYEKAGIAHAVVNGTEESDWPTVAALCSSNLQHSVSASGPRLLPSYGLHPWDTGNR